MRKIAALTAAALVAVGALGTPKAEARGGGAIAAGVIGGLAAGALLGAALSEAHAAPYGYGGHPAPVYGDAYDAPPPVRERPARVVRAYDDEDAPVYRHPRPARSYADGPYGYRPAGYGFRRDCDRPDGGYGGW
ncbi:hypothetical protein [Methylobacterium sp. J-068]|uniref:hypothetical protein n=1 Tax=Methylobacterium sp. J-068 TaxID=2836649 RepID=UPI001FBAFA9F|nr:hypothetical protein [Methylobacterium sp. J-068]MCJ2035776.1 hypothetical protein [Methylobacterium sp. J-068]